MNKPAKIILYRMLGFLSFLILLSIANILVPIVNQRLYTSILVFFNINMILLFILTCIGIVNDIFWSFKFPFNLPAPLTSGVLSACSIIFLYQIWEFIRAQLNIDFYIPALSLLIPVALFVIVIGYIKILVEHEKPKEHMKERLEREYKSKKVEWEDVEKEFRSVLYNIGRELNKLFKPKNKRRRR